MDQEQKIIPAITDPTIYEKKGFVPPSGLEVQKDQQSGKRYLWIFGQCSGHKN
jgi:hypothetical protein